MMDSLKELVGRKSDVRPENAKRYEFVVGSISAVAVVARYPDELVVTLAAGGAEIGEGLTSPEVVRSVDAPALVVVRPGEAICAISVNMLL